MQNKKFKLKDFLYRTRKLTLLADVYIGEEEFKNYPVGDVQLRGICDPVYIRRSLDLLDEYRDDITSESTSVHLRAANERLQVSSVVIALEGWDVDLFDMPFSKENAMKVFTDPCYAIFFNQIAHYIKERTHFLPVASQPPKAG